MLRIVFSRTTVQHMALQKVSLPRRNEQIIWVSVEGQGKEQTGSESLRAKNSCVFIQTAHSGNAHSGASGAGYKPRWDSARAERSRVYYRSVFSMEKIASMPLRKKYNCLKALVCKLIIQNTCARTLLALIVLFEVKKHCDICCNEKINTR